MPARKAPDDNSRRTRFASRLAALPTRPGVYIMRNDKGDVIYVGKAASLRNRVRNYFGAPHSLEMKTRALVEQIEDFEYIVTQNAQEALHLEATLVKRHQPFFNVRLKDDKHYPYLRIDVQNAWPRVEIARRVGKDGARYFGPVRVGVVGAHHAEHRQEALPLALLHQGDHRHRPAPLPRLLHQPLHRALHRLLHARRSTTRSSTRPSSSSKARPKRSSSRSRRRWSGASEPLQFERAALFRDQIKAVESVAEKQFVERIRPTDEDVFGLARAGRRDGQLRGLRPGPLHPRHPDGGPRLLHARRRARTRRTRDVLGSFLKQFYEIGRLRPEERRRAVRGAGGVADRRVADARSAARRSTIAVAQRGTRRRLVELATRERARVAGHAARALAGRQPEARRRPDPAARRARPADLPAPHRVLRQLEHPGHSPVASMVVFIDGQPRTRRVPPLQDQDRRSAPTTSPRWPRSSAGASSAGRPTAGRRAGQVGSKVAPDVRGCSMTTLAWRPRVRSPEAPVGAEGHATARRIVRSVTPGPTMRRRR